MLDERMCKGFSEFIFFFLTKMQDEGGIKNEREGAKFLVAPSGAEFSYAGLCKSTPIYRYGTGALSATA